MAEETPILEPKKSGTTKTVIPTSHVDTIHDATFDFSGQRLATCSADQHVCVWDTKADGQWECTTKFPAHKGPIWRIDWAHPQFGQLLVTCSFDCCVSIWQENTRIDSAGKHTLQWDKEITRLDSQSSVSDVRFAPHYYGLKFASCSYNGYVRIYEAKDIMRLNDWTLSHEFQSLNGASSICWSQSSLFHMLLAVGSDDPNAAAKHIGIYQLHVPSNKWRSILDEQTENVFRKVNDISFANWMGRSYHSLAVGGIGLYVVKIKPLENSSSAESDFHYTFQHIPLREVDKQVVEVWRVHWNITGDMLIASTNERRVTIWKQAGPNNFEIVKELVASHDSFIPAPINPAFQTGLTAAKQDLPHQETS
ncbi:Nucleoporin seh1-like isoform X2 [Oopsacas minuta]|uniref:Nucleoporin seh1-like isoform X2 n=1 Tax=Oopsacas minuta TaxID=111878 RepID=A0AAV7JY08_9METZ|nr:Nucleoporin seh1-like isoform X2 [Oopsacas minuta]